MPQASKKRKRHRTKKVPPLSLGKRLGNWVLQLLSRAAMALLRFLWEQLKWATAVCAAGAAAYVAYRIGLPWWVSSILLWVGIFIILAWGLRLLSMLFGGGGKGYHYEPQYDDKPKKRGETWREREERDWQDMHDAYQREQEDRWS
ncbi:MAG TPA: hypothetical protein VLA88_05940 [Candidatus Saccharimonadales bacterium]|nr:hypothetical protein [Candidatus Saccharimonadales bacterium]